MGPIVLGNEWLSAHVSGLAAGARRATASALCEALSAAVEGERAPVPVTVVVGTSQ